MKLLGLASLGLAQEWSKCSQLCDGGEQTQTNCSSNCVRSCNIESCSVYDDSLFTNSHVDDLTGWNCNANCQMELIDDGYSGTGIQVAARNQKWQGLSQIIDASLFTATGYVGKVFVQVAENTTEDLRLEVMAAKLLSADGTTQYEEVGRVTIPAGSTAWYPLNFAIENSNFGQFSQIKFYIQSEQTSVSYRADEFYLVDKTTILPEPVGLIRDGDFEFHQFGSDWYGNAATVEYIDATDAPKGNSYAKVSGRTAAWGGLYIDMPLDQSYVGGDTTTRFLQLSFSFKMDEGDMESWVPGDMSSPKAQIKIKNTEGQTNYINCLFACGVPDGQWQQWESNCDPIEENVGLVDTATLFINGLEHKDGTFMDFYVDDVKLDWWTRDQSWVQTANLRIDDIRKIDLEINTAGRADVASVDIRMKKADYTWGATMDKFMMNGEVTDLDPWFDLFNMGVARNEFKWEHIYRTQNSNFDDADEMLALFEQHSTPLRGHVVFWEVDGHSPDWFEAMTDNVVKEQIAWDWVNEVIPKYAGRIPNWDTFNEIVHGDDFVEMFGYDFWSRVIARIRELDPATKLAFNDFKLLSDNKGKCFTEYIKNEDLDFYGLQSHMSRGINGETIFTKLNLLSGDDLTNRLWITEFDVDQPNVSERAKDVHDFIRTAFSHPNTDGIILWTWLREKHRSWQDVPFNRALWENPELVIQPGDETIKDPIIEPEEGTCDEYNILCNWGFGPNEAGVEYLKMVKQEWNSTQIISPNDASNMRVFKGTYLIDLLDADGNVIEGAEVEITDSCDLNSVDFETEADLNLLTNAGSQISLRDGGLTGHQAALVNSRTADWAGPRFQSTSGDRFFKIAVKLLDADSNLNYDYFVTTKKVVNGENTFKRVHSGTIPNVNEWFFIETSRTIPTEEVEFYLEFSNAYTGDFLIDRMYNYPQSQWDNCKKVSLDFSGKAS